MARFAYKAVDRTGQTVSGVLAAPTAGAAHLMVLARGLQPISVEERTSVLQYELTKKKVPREEVMHFSRQLGVFVKAGIPILDSLEIIEAETTNKLFKKVLDDMVDALAAGDTFALAAEAHPEAFPPYYVGMLSSAELAGNLDTVLTQLADYMERDADARGKVTAAMIYPGVVLGMSVVTFVVLGVFVMPRFKVFFQSLHANLPLPTKMLLDLTNFIETNWYFLFGGIFAVVILIAIAFRSKQGRARIDSWVLRMPGHRGSHPARHGRADLPDPVFDDPGGCVPPRGDDGHVRIRVEHRVQAWARHHPGRDARGARPFGARREHGPVPERRPPDDARRRGDRDA